VGGDAIEIAAACRHFATNDVEHVAYEAQTKREMSVCFIVSVRVSSVLEWRRKHLRPAAFSPR
jgi:hypothetical protein